jgi:hypothetical protein
MEKTVGRKPLLEVNTIAISEFDNVAKRHTLNIYSVSWNYETSNLNPQVNYTD